jgi:broad specificity phosphatase PhoE
MAAEPVRYTVQILFLRHSESCANMIKKIDGWSGVTRRLISAVDPALTHRGEQMALNKGERLRADLSAHLGINGELVPDEGGIFQTADGARLIVGASMLRRTQQTAGFLLQGAGVQAAAGQIHLLPYISETGGGADNKRGPLQPFGEPNQIDATPLSETPDGEIPSSEKFFKWLGKYGIDADNREQPKSFLKRDSPLLRMVIVTHGNWLKELTGIEKLENKKYNNLDGAVVEILYGNDHEILSGHTVTKLFIPSEVPGDLMAIEACPDNCAGGTVCSADARLETPEQGSRARICERLQGAPGLDAKGLANLAKDLTIMEKYRSSGVRPEVAGAIKKLGSYGGWSGRQRENIAADVMPIQVAYGCGVEGGDVCQDLDTLYTAAERGDPVSFLKLQTLLQKISQERGGNAATLRAAAVLKDYRTRTGFFGRSRDPRELVSDLKAIHGAARCQPTTAGPPTVCTDIQVLLDKSDRELELIENDALNRVARRLPVKQNRNRMESYKEKRGWWSTHKRSRNSLRANLTAIGDRLQCPHIDRTMQDVSLSRGSSTAPVGENLPPPLSKQLNQTTWGGARRRSRRGHGKSRRITRRRHAARTRRRH